MNPYTKLFEPMQVGPIVFRNRILSGPNMMCALGASGAPTDYLVSYYEEKAKGGAAQVTVGDTPVEERGATNPRHPVLTNLNLAGWSEVARAIRQHGAVASIELNHGGRVSNSNITGFEAVGPVDMTKPGGAVVRGMTEDDIVEVAAAYAQKAKLAKDAGFDMIMLHGAHGWLLDQMLSPKYNKRTDRFGGAFENRCRFPLMVIDAVREAVGKLFPIEYRIGPELIEGGLSIEEVTAFCEIIQDKVDLIHVSAGLDTDPQYAVQTHPTMFLPHGVNVCFAAAVKQVVTKVPVVAVGSITSPEEAEEILEKGYADAVAMVRSLIADPYLPEKARQGRPQDIRPCLRCLDCLTGMHTCRKFACAVNPRTGHEARLDREKTTVHPKRVLVVGGGPGGMEAAATAAELGHDVTLWEQSDALGGLLKFTDFDTLKSDLKRLKDYLIHRVKQSGVRVEFGKTATPDSIREYAPDALLIAAGSSPVVFRLPGIETAQHATTAYTDLDSLGKTVAVMGGGLVGCETALFLTETGREVTIIEMKDSVAPDANWMHRTAMLQAFSAKKNLHIRTGLRCTEVTDDGIKAEDMNGNPVLIEAESKIYAFGQQRNAVLELLLPEIPYVRIIGDCKTVGKTNGAIFDGYHAAMDI